MSWFALFSWTAVIVTVALCSLRSRFYATFRAVLLSVHTLIATAVLPHLAAEVAGALSLAGALSTEVTPAESLTTGPGLVLLYLHAVVFLDALFLIRPRPRSLVYRATISLPAQYFSASTLLALPWALVTLFGVEPRGVLLAYALGLAGLYQSITLKKERFLLEVGAVAPKEGVVRLPASEKRGLRTQTEQHLRLVQITDPHLGPFMSVSRLKKICREAVAEAPDLIVLTGDFLTMESQQSADPLREALSPLSGLSGRVYACLGNHDHEALELVKTALLSNQITLLVDEGQVVQTRVGPVELLGFDFHFQARKERMRQVLDAHPRSEGLLRIALLHDPGAFKHLPNGAADLVLSGHTHGGQVGLVSLGGTFTLAHAIAKIPDHGLWAQGTNRLYVHRGTGHYGYPLRLGVPAEQSVIHLAHTRESPEMRPEPA